MLSFLFRRETSGLLSADLKCCSKDDTDHGWGPPDIATIPVSNQCLLVTIVTSVSNQYYLVTIVTSVSNQSLLVTIVTSVSNEQLFVTIVAVQHMVRYHRTIIS